MNISPRNPEGTLNDLAGSLRTQIQIISNDIEDIHAAIAQQIAAFMSRDPRPSDEFLVAFEQGGDHAVAALKNHREFLKEELHRVSQKLIAITDRKYQESEYYSTRDEIEEKHRILKANDWRTKRMMKKSGEEPS